MLAAPMGNRWEHAVAGDGAANLHCQTAGYEHRSAALASQKPPSTP